ncbi:MAG: hypothetical protein JWM40_2921 [Frankiales bacterium]|nr:hypothetical protein [Frankiales bacterium]
MTTAQDRGWGDRQSTAVKNAQILVEAGGIKVRCHRAIAPLVKYLLNETVRRGYPLAGGTPDDWAYANRCIRGTGPGTSKPCVPSNHSWGLALDLNSTSNPMTEDGRVHTNMPQWMVDLWKAWGFTWGGGYSHSRKDPMHYEFLGTPADAKRLCASLERLLAHPANAPKPKPTTVKKARVIRNPYRPQIPHTVVAVGSHGEHVEFIQWAVRATIDGDYGPATKAAVVRFQKAHRLRGDGKVGDLTLAVLLRITR